MTVLGYFFAPAIAGRVRPGPHTLAMAADNIRWLCLFNVAFAVNFILSAALRASGDAWSPLWISGGGERAEHSPAVPVSSSAHSDFRRWVWRCGRGRGSCVHRGGLVLVGLWMKQKFRVKHVGGGWWRKSALKRLLDIGYPGGLEQVVFQLGFFIFLMLIGNFYGTEAFAAYNIGVNVLQVCMTVGFGFSIAGSTLVGQHLGADDHDGAARAAGVPWDWPWSPWALGRHDHALRRDLTVFFLGDEPETVSARWSSSTCWVA